MKREATSVSTVLLLLLLCFCACLLFAAAVAVGVAIFSVVCRRIIYRHEQVLIVLLLYEQMPVGNNGTFQQAQEGKRQGDQMKVIPDAIVILEMFGLSFRDTSWSALSTTFLQKIYAVLCRMAKFDADSLHPALPCSSLKHDSFSMSPLAVLSRLRPRFAYIHPGSLRACAEPRRASAPRGEAPLV